MIGAGGVEGLPRVLEIRTGSVGVVEHRGRQVRTAFRKARRSGPVAVSDVGLAGDEQADQRVHGGPDKAICVYAVEHYDWWREQLGTRLPAGSFGENLLVRSLIEPDVYLGARYQVGTLLLEVSMPRRPCFKLGAIHGLPELPELFQNSGRTGFYFRVLEQGVVTVGNNLRLVSEPDDPVSVAEVNRVMNIDRHDLQAAAPAKHSAACAREVATKPRPASGRIRRGGRPAAHGTHRVEPGHPPWARDVPPRAAPARRG